MSETPDGLFEMTTGIVAAYIGNNAVAVGELPGLIKVVHNALRAVQNGGDAEPTAPQQPAVSVRKSITSDFLICLEDGRKFKSLKRHLRTKYDLSPEQYRAKWGLAKDYPMVAPAYAEARSKLAKAIGLGSRDRGKAPAKRGRAKAKSA
jgi:predicted transcriptional regulator